MSLVPFPTVNIDFTELTVPEKDDPNLDPISGNNNNNSTLLSGSNVTESHLMGFTVLAPPSTLADDIIPAFDAAKAQAEIVSEPNFPALEDANNAFLPAAPTSDPAAQWPAVKNAWESPTLGTDAGQEFVDVWTGLMGWVLDGAVPLVGEAPKLTMAAFDQTYMAAPLLQV